MIHNGHLAHLREAKTHGDVLVVGITTVANTPKGPGRPVMNDEQRLEHMAELAMVDYAVIDYGNGDGCVLTLKPDVFVKGADYDAVPESLKKAAESIGAEVYITTAPTDSSSRISARTFTTYSSETEAWLAEFRLRHSAYEVLAALDSIKDTKILVVGEHSLGKTVFVDIWPHLGPGQAHFQMDIVEEIALNDAATAILNHCKEFSENTNLFTEGKPSHTIEILNRVTKQGLGSLYQGLRDEKYTPETHDAALKKLYGAVGQADVVLVADYGLGSITPEMRSVLQSSGKFLAVTGKSDAMNNWWPGAKHWSPDLFAANEDEWGVVKKVHFTQAGMKTSSSGCTIYGTNGEQSMTPSFAVDVKDPIGCGDAVLAYAGPLAYRGVPLDVTSFIGMCAAAMQCEVTRNEKPVDLFTLRKFITRLLA